MTTGIEAIAVSTIDGADAKLGDYAGKHRSAVTRTARLKRS